VANTNDCGSLSGFVGGRKRSEQHGVRDDPYESSLPSREHSPSGKARVRFGREIDEQARRIIDSFACRC